MIVENPQTFVTPQALGDWFAKNAGHETALWVRIYKVASGVPSVTWDDCVTEALRVGWIDGIKKSLDATSYAQRLTPRRARSIWSARNVGICERLIADGRMLPGGQAQVDAARSDGRWDAAYGGPATLLIPDWFMAELDKHPAARQRFDTLNRRNLFAVSFRLQTAKTDKTRAARMAKMIEILNSGGQFHD